MWAHKAFIINIQILSFHHTGSHCCSWVTMVWMIIQYSVTRFWSLETLPIYQPLTLQFRMLASQAAKHNHLWKVSIWSIIAGWWHQTGTHQTEITTTNIDWQEILSTSSTWETMKHFIQHRFFSVLPFTNNQFHNHHKYCLCHCRGRRTKTQTQMWAEMTLFYWRITIILPIVTDDFNLVLKFDWFGLSGAGEVRHQRNHWNKINYINQFTDLLCRHQPPQSFMDLVTGILDVNFKWTK